MIPNETQIFTAEYEGKGNTYTLSTDRDKLDIDYILEYLNQSYWGKRLTKEALIRSIQGSISYGIYHKGKQVGFARAVTDMTSFAYLMDVFVNEAHNGRGIGTWLAKIIFEHPDSIKVEKWRLATRDAHKVYERAGWKSLAHPEWMMEKLKVFDEGEPETA